jgi:hypothetical protein
VPNGAAEIPFLLSNILREISEGFEDEARRVEHIEFLLRRFPKVTPQEYILLIPHLWANDLWDQYWLCHCSYKDFLKSDYWRAISTLAKKNHPWCAQCGEYLEQLHVHHKTYVRRGLEWRDRADLADLEVLCHNCHKEEHRRQAKNA